ncbi:MAG: tyrosine-type recombinase/integrase, partial [Sphaerochaeta sp.]|nr:tyrosine-type recombinase/integrase [Sphaerochaeta sp.]
ELIRISPQNAITETAAQGQQNAALVYVAGLASAGGRRTMAQALDKVARMISNGQLGIDTFPWYGLGFQHVAAIRAKLAETLAPATVNKTLSALRGTLRTAWRLGQMTAEQYGAAADVKGVRGETIPAGRELTAGELGALMAVCANDPSAAGARDAALIGLLYAAGLRRAEAVALDLGDYNPETGELRIMGKGHKQRLAWLNNGAAQAMADWLAIRGGDPGPMFWPVNKGGRLIPQRMTAQAIYNLLAKRADQASVKTFSPHDLRRTFVSDLLDAGADIATVQKMAGHSNVQTTARYDRRPEAAKQRAAQLLHVPYHKRGL